jgi:hypothetical protein
MGAWPVTAGAATAGTATIVQPNSLEPLDAGGSGTAYGVSLPSNASCPGDTAHDGYHVYSYLIPAGHTPAEVSFKTGVPSRWYGYISYGDYYGAVNTAEDTGQVITPPLFSWTRYTSYLGDLFPDGVRHATWDGGIACADTDGVVTNYWNTQIVFTRTSADPGGFTWRVVAAPPATSDNTGLILGVCLLVAAALLGALVVVASRRRRSDSGGPGPAGPGGPGGRGPERGPDTGAHRDGGADAPASPAPTDDSRQPTPVAR